MDVCVDDYLTSEISDIIRLDHSYNYHLAWPKQQQQFHVA